MDHPLITVLPDPEQLAGAAARHIAAQLRRAIARRGIAHCVLTGGRTPLPTYRFLAQSPLAVSVDWDRVHFWWTDERWLPADDAASNQRAARAELLEPLAIAHTWVHAVDVSAPTADAAAADYEHCLSRWLGNRGLFDVVVLGVGEDGHIASLFPGSSTLMPPERRRVVVEHRAPKPPSVRVSLTLMALAAARSHVLLIEGKTKAGVVRQLCEPSHSDLPIQRLLALARNVRIYVDEAAFSHRCVSRPGWTQETWTQRPPTS